MSNGPGPGIFREVNERIAEIVGTWHWEEKQGFLCECATGQCTQAVWLTRAEYDAIRARRTLFFTAPGHEQPGDARVVERHEDFVVIETPWDEPQRELRNAAPLVDAHRQA
jgi:hypothetical protein